MSRRTRILLLPVLVATTTLAGSPQAPTIAGETLRATRIPVRPEGALSGSEFARKTTGWSGSARQRAIVEELSRGNLPGFLRDLRPIRLLWQPPGRERPLEARIWVMPDYLAVGSTADYLRVTLDLDR